MVKYVGKEEPEVEVEDDVEDEDAFDPETATSPDLIEAVIEQLDPADKIHRSILKVQLASLSDECLRIIYGCVADILEDLEGEDEEGGDE